MSLLEVLNATIVQSDRRVLEGQSLSIFPGKVTAILGENGAGKSTLLKAVAGEVEIDEGRILFDNRDCTKITSMGRYRLGIAFVPEAAKSLFDDLTVTEHLLVALRHQARSARLERISQLLHQFPMLTARASTMARSLSGGQRQILAIATALAWNPKLLILDEPCHGLSPSMREQLTVILQELKRTGLSILFSEQFVQVATSVSDQCLILKNGRLTSFDSLQGV